MENKTKLSDKTCVVVDNGLFIEQAIKLAKDFGKVKYFMPWKNSFPKRNAAQVGMGAEGVERILDLFDHLDTADIVVFPDVYDGDLQNFLVKRGMKVFGGRKGEELELYRKESKEFLKSIKQPVGQYWIAKGTKELRALLKEHKDVWVKISLYRGEFETFHSPRVELVEPLIDQIEHNMGPMSQIQEFIIEECLKDKVEIGYDGYCVNGKWPGKGIIGTEVKDLGYLAKFVDYKSIPKEITGFNEAITPAMTAYGYAGFISSEIRVGKDKIPYMIDACMRCFSEDTEVLTDKGWRFFKNLDKTEKLVTLNTTTKNIEYQVPTRYINKYVEEDLILLTNKQKTIESLTTKDHDILVMKETKKEFLKIQATKLTGELYIPRTGEWSGNNTEKFIVPGINRKGKNGKSFIKEPLEVSMIDWAEFLGWYLAEGYCTKSVVTIYQIKHIDKIENLLNRLGIGFGKHAQGVSISSTQLAEYLKQYGKSCDTKYIPDYILNSNQEILNSFYTSYLLGDGHRKTNTGNSRIVTTSKKIADQLQEIILKLGGVARIYSKQPDKKHSSIINNRVCQTKKIIYNVEISFCRPYFKLIASGKRKEEFIKSIPYKGKVYCVTVPNNTLYVRRKGKPFWSGNCGSPPNELYMEMYSNYSEIIWNAANGICIDPIAKQKFGVEVLMHCAFADSNWSAINFPKEYRDNIKFRNLTVINGKHYIVPQALGLPEIGAIVATGDTMKEAINKVKAIADTVEGYDLTIPMEAIDKGLEEVKKSEEYGIKLF